MQPFIPDRRNALPENWKVILKQWVSGKEVSEIGSHHMRVVEDAFMYRLVWALEAIRTRRVSLGWLPDVMPGGGAAALETGVPRFMMSMLIRVGLPSRRAAMVAIESSDANFASPAEMRLWLESNEIAALTAQGDWPTRDTAALWKRFRDDALAANVQKWGTETFKRLLALPGGASAPQEGLYRILPELDEDRRTWLATPDYQLVSAFVKPIDDQRPSLLSGKLSGDTKVVEAFRMGRGKARWPLTREPAQS